MNPEHPDVLARTYRLYRDYFARAEKKRRWNLVHDIPWDQCHRQIDPAIADLIESLYAAELYLPDYVGGLIRQARAQRGRVWMLNCWGYEESKHSLALADWLLWSGQRSEEQLADFDREVFRRRWEMPHDNPRAMMCYSMVQELAAWVHYQNLRKIVDDKGDPALLRILNLIAIDERAHFDFFKRLVMIYLEDDRLGTLVHLRRVLDDFRMPGFDLLPDSRQRIDAIRDLRIFDDEILARQVVEPLLAELKVSREAPHEALVG